jgi:hypothetical protein
VAAAKSTFTIHRSSRECRHLPIQGSIPFPDSQGRKRSKHTALLIRRRHLPIQGSIPSPDSQGRKKKQAYCFAHQEEIPPCPGQHPFSRFARPQRTKHAALLTRRGHLPIQGSIPSPSSQGRRLCLCVSAHQTRRVTVGVGVRTVSRQRAG